MVKLFKSFFFIFLFLIFSFSFLQFSRIDLDKEEIINSIISSQSWIKKVQKEDGLFGYEYNLNNNSFSDSNNMVRQIGTFYSLIKSLEINSNFSLINSIYEFNDEIKSNYLKYDFINGTKIAYVEYDNISKINSNSLYLLSLIEMKKKNLSLDIEDYNNINSLYNGIKLMSSSSGGFYYIYYLDRDLNKITPYGSGEALFALMSYYNNIDSNDELLRFLEKNFESLYLGYINEDFNGENLRSFYSWSLYFLYEYSLNSNNSNTLDLDFKSYANELINKAMSFRESNPICRNSGCIISRGISGVTFLEGTSIGYKLLSFNNYNRIRVINYFNKAYPYYLSLQHFDKNISSILNGGFCNNENCNLFRIDYNQHAMMALMNIYPELE